MAHEGMVNVRIVGDEKLLGMIQGLSSEQRFASILRKSVTDVAQRIILPQLAAEAPESFGDVARRRRAKGHLPLSHLMDVNIRRRGGVVQARIGAIYPQAAHAHLTDQGTKDRYAIQRDLAGSKLVYQAGRSIFKANERSKHGRGWMVGRTVYQRSMTMFRGRVPAQHWVQRAWAMISSEACEELAADVIRRWEADLDASEAKSAAAMQEFVSGLAKNPPPLYQGTLMQMGRMSKRAGRTKYAAAQSGAGVAGRAT